MSTSTMTAATKIPASQRRTDRALMAFARAIVSIETAVAAAEELAESLDELTQAEVSRIDVAWHMIRAADCIAWNLAEHLSVIDGELPPDARDLLPAARSS